MDSLAFGWQYLSQYLTQATLIIILLAYSSWYIFGRRPVAKSPRLSREEEDKIIDAWNPEPLVPDSFDPGHFALHPRIVSKYGPRIVLDGKPCLDLATHDYLNFVRRSECLDAAVETAKKYGVGSCGPRGFFGTVDVHVQLEQKISEFMKTEETILYSYGYSTVSSAIPAYAKVNDVIFA